MNISTWKKRKKELHWTYDDLARESGVSRRTIAGIFSGDERYSSPTLNTIESIESALGLSQKTKLSDDDKALGADDVAMFHLSEEEQDLIELRSEIIRIKGEAFWKTLEEMLQAIAKEEK